jgi:hypothetical protein
MELREISALLKHEWRGRYRTNLWIPRLERIVRPILDAEDLCEPDGRNRSSILRIVLTEVIARRSVLWGWSTRIWAKICCASRSAFTERYGVAGSARLPFLAVAILLKQPVQLEGCGVFERILLAQKVFGQKAVDSAMKQVADILRDWGYGVSHNAHNGSVLAELMLLSRSPLLQDISRDAFRRSVRDMRADSEVLCATAPFASPAPSGTYRSAFAARVGPPAQRSVTRPGGEC